MSFHQNLSVPPQGSNLLIKCFDIPSGKQFLTTMSFHQNYLYLHKGSNSWQPCPFKTISVTFCFIKFFIPPTVSLGSMSFHQICLFLLKESNFLKLCPFFKCSSRDLREGKGQVQIGQGWLSNCGWADCMWFSSEDAQSKTFRHKLQLTVPEERHKTNNLDFFNWILL